MKNNIYLLILSTLICINFSCKKEEILDTEPVMPPEPTLEVSLNFSIEGETEQTFNYSCIDAYSRMTLTGAYSSSLDSFMIRQGYQVDISDDSYISCDLIIFDAENEIYNDFNPQYAKPYIIENINDVHLDIEYKKSDILYRNQFYDNIPLIENFSSRTIVEEVETKEIMIGELVSFDCTDSEAMLDVSIEYKGVVKTENTMDEKEVNINMNFKIVHM